MSLRIVITASGSLGDVHPFIAIGLILKQRGHKVSIATEHRWRDHVDNSGLDSRLLGGDLFGALFEPKYQDTLRRQTSRSLSTVNREWDLKFDSKEIYNSYVVACSGADLIISNEHSLMQSYCVSEYLQCAWLPVFLSPQLVTSEFPHWATSSISIFAYCCTCLNKSTYIHEQKKLWKSQRTSINTWRREILDLPVIRDSRGIFAIIDRLHSPVIIACSPAVCGPYGRSPADYGIQTHMHGFIFNPTLTDQEISTNYPELVQFMSDSSLASTTRSSNPVHRIATHPNNRKLIFLGLGAFPTPNPVAMLQLALQICVDCDCRCVVVADWPQLFDRSNNNSELNMLIRQAYADGTMCVVKYVPHGWLFPKVECIVHHGGVGTMAAALRSGVPQIPVPTMTRDQLHNAKTLVRLGVAPGIVKFSQLQTHTHILVTYIKAMLANIPGSNSNVNNGGSSSGSAVNVSEIRRNCQLLRERIEFESRCSPPSDNNNDSSTNNPDEATTTVSSAGATDALSKYVALIEEVGLGNTHRRVRAAEVDSSSGYSITTASDKQQQGQGDQFRSSQSCNSVRTQDSLYHAAAAGLGIGARNNGIKPSGGGANQSNNNSSHHNSLLLSMTSVSLTDTSESKDPSRRGSERSSTGYKPTTATASGSGTEKSTTSGVAAQINAGASGMSQPLL